MKISNYPQTFVSVSFFLLAALLAPVVHAQQTATDKLPEETYKDWKVKCMTTSQNGTPARQCFMSQALYLVKSKQKVFELLIDPPSEKNISGAAIIMPLGILIPKGVAVSVRGVKPFNLGVRSCSAGGCVSQFGINGEIIDAFKAAGKVSFQMIDSKSNKPIDLSMSLSGFSAAHARLLDLHPRK